MKNIFLLSILILFTACKTGKQSRPETASFEMIKTPCFGTCPEYTFTLDITGKATFDGKRNVDKIGLYQKTFTYQEVRKLIDAFEAANFWAFKEKYYDPGVSDMPSTYVTFNHNTKSKKVEDQFNAPKELKALEKMLEELANSEGWTKSETK